MAIIIDPNIASSGLAFSIDAANMRSYSGIGTVIYDLCSGLGGTLFNGVTFSQSPSPYFDFDGTNDYIGFPKLDVLNGKTAFTFSVFCAREGGFLGINQGVSYPESTFLSLYSSTVYFSISANTGAQAYGYYFNTSTSYRHFVAVFDGTQTGNSNRLKMYENGVEQSISFSGTIPNITTTAGSEFEIGANRAFSSFTSSSVSTIQLYNRALSAQEIKNNFEATRDRYGI
jgi:hypothetical protein